MSESDNEGSRATAQQPLGLAISPEPRSQSNPYTAKPASHATKDGKFMDSVQPAMEVSAISNKQSQQPESDDGAASFDQARIAARIKGLYKELLEAPIPDEWIRLVKAIETKERK